MEGYEVIVFVSVEVYEVIVSVPNLPPDAKNVCHC